MYIETKSSYFVVMVISGRVGDRNRCCFIGGEEQSIDEREEGVAKDTSQHYMSIHRVCIKWISKYLIINNVILLQYVCLNVRHIHTYSRNMYIIHLIF